MRRNCIFMIALEIYCVDPRMRLKTQASGWGLGRPANLGSGHTRSKKGHLLGAVK